IDITCQVGVIQKYFTYYTPYNIVCQGGKPKKLYTLTKKELILPLTRFHLPINGKILNLFLIGRIIMSYSKDKKLITTMEE
ncbi:MAG TPA: hypothetical protein PLS20_05485, partial [Ruminococcus flavefaciens]|nr:hypothetical protein [Ruminococcus flavefaciens]